MQDPKYIAASDNYLKAFKEAKVLEIATRAFEHRKRALEHLTKLFLNNYYAEPYVPKKAEDAVHSKTRQEINEKLMKGNNDEKIKPSLRKRHD